MLLVLDNCEHVIEAAAALAVDTLRGRRACGFWRPAASRYAPRANTCTVCPPVRALAQRGSFPLPRLSTSRPIVRGTRGGDNERIRAYRCGRHDRRGNLLKLNGILLASD